MKSSAIKTSIHLGSCRRAIPIPLLVVSVACALSACAKAPERVVEGTRLLEILSELSAVEHEGTMKGEVEVSQGSYKDAMRFQFSSPDLCSADISVKLPQTPETSPVPLSYEIEWSVQDGTWRVQVHAPFGMSQDRTGSVTEEWPSEISFFKIPSVSPVLALLEIFGSGHSAYASVADNGDLLVRSGEERSGPIGEYGEKWREFRLAGTMQGETLHLRFAARYASVDGDCMSMYECSIER